MYGNGYVQIPMAVKEAACAKLSIPWRPNLGIQRVSNAKGSLAYKCFWHPQAPGSNVLGINWVAYPNTHGSCICGEVITAIKVAILYEVQPSIQLQLR